MFGFPRLALLLWLAVLAAGATIVGGAAAAATADQRLALSALFFAVAGALAMTFSIPMPSSRPGHTLEVSVGSSLLFGAVLLFPAYWSSLVAALANVLAFGVIRRIAWYKATFNICQSAVSTFFAAAVWHVGSAGRSFFDPQAIPALLAAMVAYFLANTVLTSAMVALASGVPVRLTWWRTYRHILPAYSALLCVGALIAVLWSVAAWTIALATIPLAGLYYALRNTATLETQTVDALFNLASILDDRDPYTHGHSLRVGDYAQQLALAVGESADQAYTIFLAGRLHDIGKCAVANEVLRKPGALDPAERAHMCTHAAIGGSMLAHFSLFRECARYVRGHHERWDGAGYPDGLRAEEIPFGARVIAVADAFDAMTTTRPYRTALPEAEAIRRLREGAGSHWDATLVATFVALLEEGSLKRAALQPPTVVPLAPAGVAVSTSPA